MVRVSPAAADMMSSCCVQNNDARGRAISTLQTRPAGKIVPAARF
jgi:hypothetical protein